MIREEEEVGGGGGGEGGGALLSALGTAYALLLCRVPGLWKRGFDRWPYGSFLELLPLVMTLF